VTYAPPTLLLISMGCRLSGGRCPAQARTPQCPPRAHCRLGSARQRRPADRCTTVLPGEGAQGPFLARSRNRAVLGDKSFREEQLHRGRDHVITGQGVWGNNGTRAARAACRVTSRGLDGSSYARRMARHVAQSCAVFTPPTVQRREHRRAREHPSITLECAASSRRASPRYDGPVAARRPVRASVKKLSAENRAWLGQRLREYRRLLAYLRDH
jgi:hypothetical protein